MWRALLTLIVFVATAAGAQELALKRRYEHRFDKPGWDVFAHGQKLVAFNRETLQIEILNAADGEQTASDALDSQERLPRLVDTLSSSRGEFLIALAGRDHMVELHTVQSDSAYEVHVASAPIALKLVEGREGEIFLVIGTREEVAVYRRAGPVLEVVRALPSSIGYKQVQAMRSRTGLLVLTMYDDDNKVHVVQLDAAGGAHEDITLTRAAARLEPVVDLTNNDFIGALVGPRSVRFYLEGQAGDSPALTAAPTVGGGQWIHSSDGRPLFAITQRAQGGAQQLAIIDPRAPTEAVRLGIGDAASVTDVGSFLLRGKTYYYYVRDHKYLYIQNEDEVSAVPARINERITGVKLIRSAKALGVILESDRGTRLQLVGMG